MGFKIIFSAIQNYAILKMKALERKISRLVDKMPDGKTIRELFFSIKKQFIQLWVLFRENLKKLLLKEEASKDKTE